MPVIDQFTSDTSIKAKLAKVNAELEGLKQLESVIESIRRLRRDYPDLLSQHVREIQTAMHEVIDSESKNDLKEDPASVSSAFERILKWFVERDNTNARLTQVAEGTSLALQTVKNIVYNRRKDAFKTQKTLGGTSYIKLNTAILGNKTTG